MVNNLKYITLLKKIIKCSLSSLKNNKSVILNINLICGLLILLNLQLIYSFYNRSLIGHLTLKSVINRSLMLQKVSINCFLLYILMCIYNIFSVLIALFEK
jgi:hypothetical protein